MLRKLSPAALMALALIIVTGFSGIAWQKNPSVTKAQQQQDTIPRKEKEIVIDGDLDRALEEVNRATENLQRQLEKMDWKKLHQDMSASIEKINSKKIQEQIARAMREVDRQKIHLRTQEALQNINWEKMRAQIDKAQDAISSSDRGKMKEHMQRAMEESKRAMERMKSIDSKEMHREMEKAMEKIKMQGGEMKEAMERARKSGLKYLGDDFDKKMEKVREKMKRAGEELRNYKEMVEEMDKDGLLKIKEPYSIEYNNEELIINGTKQPPTVTDKYKHYFKNGRVTIKKDKEDGHRTIYL